MLAPYAVRPGTSRGRRFAEPEAVGRSPWQRDRDRIIHSSAFRKLQYKTQVFVNHEGDFYRTRLTHSIEVAQIARSISRELGLDEDLTEALALAHDLGHPPFGHAGEEALRAAMEGHGGYDHNAQSLRIVTLLEQRYAGFDGLNLTWETLEGLAKHNGPIHDPAPYVSEFEAAWPLDLPTFAGGEAQVAALADDIAYHSHDLDDGLRAELFTTDDIAALPVVGPALEAARALRTDRARLRHETVRRVINALATDVKEESRRRLRELAPQSAADIRTAPGPAIGFSPVMDADNVVIKEFLRRRMYRHWRVNRQSAKARRVVEALFRLFAAQPDTLPDHLAARANPNGPGSGDPGQVARVVADYIAGMTDRFAMDEHRRLTDPYISG